MRVFIYGMQSSGASLFAFLLSQGRIGVVDLWNPYVAPWWFWFRDCVLKAVVTTIPLEKHLRSFKPHKTILFLRDRDANYRSLAKKSWRDQMGTIDEKFEKLDRLDRSLFDAVVRYEDLVGDPECVRRQLADIGIEADLTVRYDIPQAKAITMKNRWCRRYYRRKWGYGNIHSMHNPSSQHTDAELRIKDLGNT